MSNATNNKPFGSTLKVINEVRKRKDRILDDISVFFYRLYVHIEALIGYENMTC